MHILKGSTSALRASLRALTPTCREVTRLQSDALDQELSPATRIGLRVHLLLCVWCRRYGKQIRFLRQALHEHPDDFSQASSARLSPEARERLKGALRKQAE